jgi:putative membrane protein
MTKTLALSLALLAGGLSLLAGPAVAADPLPTAEVLGQLHAANQKEIEAGKLAQKNGTSRAVKEYGDMLVKDHGAADKLVVALAKQEKINLAAATPAEAGTMAMVPAGGAFDLKFAQIMVDDHTKDIAEAIEARDSTTDSKLKALLTELIPTLQKHQEAAQRIAGGGAK